MPSSELIPPAEWEGALPHHWCLTPKPQTLLVPSEYLKQVEPSYGVQKVSKKAY